MFEKVRADYVQPVSDRELIDNALNGMLTGLDPHSSYMDKKQFADMQVQTRGQFGGLGLEVSGKRRRHQRWFRRSTTRRRRAQG